MRNLSYYGVDYSQHDTEDDEGQPGKWTLERQLRQNEDGEWEPTPGENHWQAALRTIRQSMPVSQSLGNLNITVNGNASCDPPHAPAGKPVRSGVQEGMNWEEFEDGTRICRQADKSVVYLYSEEGVEQHGVKQFTITADGTAVTFYENGDRRQVFANGTILEVRQDVKIQTSASGVVMESFSNGRVLQRNRDGSTIEIFPDHALYEGDWPLEMAPSGEQGDWPAIKKINRGAHKTHYIGREGTDIQISEDGSMIVRWAPGSYPLAEEHYKQKEKEWCMQVNPDGSCIFLHHLGYEFSEGGTSTTWAEDKFWDERAGVPAPVVEEEQQWLEQY
eukprot:TRINITY_DN214_c0_g1_i2.p1 TRINITY_DN214_c0_g1~~TRINITY_DN214_c0_g1_i2.p1  ORF type:complete len:333 (+),score=78.51 TRINITY_DN214_c0_g1_i2:388-1386(+)